MKASCVYHRGVILYMECRSLPSLRYFGHVGFLCSILATAAAVENCISLKLSSSLAGPEVQYVIAGCMARPTEYKSSPLPPSLSSSQTGHGTSCWVNFLLPAVSVGVSFKATESSTIQLQYASQKTVGVHSLGRKRSSPLPPPKQLRCPHWRQIISKI